MFRYSFRKLSLVIEQNALDLVKRRGNLYRNLPMRFLFFYLTKIAFAIFKKSLIKSELKAKKYGVTCYLILKCGKYCLF